ncbi:LIM and calponin homology domains-containing protein 1-like isoform X7 [Xenopus laevis]|uniref:LIM and calponin homology domains-containing protein 1-like isoform X7 n=1 Tax=Xenopus laevis TaxID=8355 RepID=A0A8J0U726_XENLA|nr:LIM and calponin homology domains-containing protein 1-like isoform X7 [Xenopus laevis]
MASSDSLKGEEIPQPPESPPDTACREAQKWIEQVTGKSFGDRDFRTGLENGILLCELLNAIKPGLVKKINRLPTPIAGLDNITLFLRGCKELGLKESQLFDPGDLQDTANRTTGRTSDCNRKLRNVLITLYWLGRTANGCSSYSGTNLDLKEFEGLLAQMRKENEEIESPKRSIRDSGYIDCWDSERSDSLSPPRHGRDDSFDSLDSFGSRSQQTPSPDVVLRGSSDGKGSDSESDLPHRRIPDVRKDDMSARRVSYGENKAFVPFNQYLPNRSNQTAYIPAPLRKKKAEREDYRKSWSTATSPLGGERPFRSMSMCDMRYEEEGSMLPHSKAHYDHLEQVNSLLKEEDDTWQNDLARWKTRRRSASQDLIKKEEERKKIERLMSGETELSERRKSIKTYREIVKEKERRERELHEAYKNAKTRDEAEHILQSYIEKFTISEAVLEGLVMPTFLEKSQSVEPSLLSSSEDPNPLKYLREQSLPSPKYTSTVEATVFPSSPCEAKSPTGLISPSKNISSKTVPMLTAKPYSQPKNTQEVLKTFKVDGKVNLNGVEEQKGKEHESQTFAPSLTQSQMFEGVARVDAPVVEIKKDIASIELNLARPNNLNLLHESKSLHEDSNHINQEDEPDSLVLEESLYSVEQLSEGNTQSNSTTQDVPAVSSIEIPPLTVNGTDTEDERKVEAAELIMHWSLDSNYSEAKENSLQPLKSSENVDESSKIKVNESSNKVQLNITLQTRNAWRRSQFFLQPVDIECTEKSPALVPNLNSPNRFCTWDPEEERKRQEKWQQEQERLLQERYQKEQEKLKEEWEKAQKEVEEEERKYYEEERKIIEDTVVPITLSPNSNVHFNISERNGNFIPALTDHAKRDQENNNEKLMAESNRAIKSEIHTQSNVTQQQLFYTQEGSMLAAEETQIKGKTEKRDAEPCNHVQSNECNTPTRLTLQAGFKQATSSESGLPGDLESLKTPVDENAAHQNMSSLISTRGTDSKEGTVNSSQLSTSQCQSPNRSVSGKKLCSTCGLPLGKGAAMIIETLSLYFHIQCFKCGLCKGQLGDTITGTDVRIRNGLLNCNDCYIKSRTAGHPTPL